MSLSLKSEELIVDLGGQTVKLKTVADLEPLLARVEEDDDIPFWAELWPSALGLARFIWQGPDLAGQKVLELGAGLGLPGIAAAFKGAAVTQTDLVPASLEWARENARLNGFGLIGEAPGIGRESAGARPHDEAPEVGQAAEVGQVAESAEVHGTAVVRGEAESSAFSRESGMGCGCLSYDVADWRNFTVPGKFDFLLASDVLYEPKLYPALARIPETHLAQGGAAFFADPGRADAPRFIAEMAAKGWRARESGISVEKDGYTTQVRIYSLTKGE